MSSVAGKIALGIGMGIASLAALAAIAAALYADNNLRSCGHQLARGRVGGMAFHTDRKGHCGHWQERNQLWQTGTNASPRP